jgi:hypothetical protein
VGRNWLGVVLFVALVAAVGAVAALSRGGDAAPKQRTPSIASQHFGDDADLMRRLERKKLVAQKR